MQAISGAGYPGVSSMDILDNVVPFIGGEEEKLDIESKKVLGKVREPADYKLSAYCNRVNVIDGHLESIFINTKEQVDLENIINLMSGFASSGLYTGPFHPIIVRTEKNRPQTRLDRYGGEGSSPYTKGMSVSVGRFKKTNDYEVGFVALGHNTIRGGAGEAILIGELLEKEGYL
jgi:aspartate-semialdehyde dehydrogenase